jgi:hypothetical protein
MVKLVGLKFKMTETINDPLQCFSDNWDASPPEIFFKVQTPYSERVHAISFIQLECSYITTKPPILIIKLQISDHIKEMRIWCNSNLKDKHMLIPYNGLWCCFWNKRDAIHFRLKWGNGEIE